MAKFNPGDLVQYIGPTKMYTGTWKIGQAFTNYPPTYYSVELFVAGSNLVVGHKSSLYEHELQLAGTPAPVAFKVGDQVRLKNGELASEPHRGPWTLTEKGLGINSGLPYWNVKHQGRTHSWYETQFELMPTQAVVADKCVCELMQLLSVGCKCGQMERERNASKV